MKQIQLVILSYLLYIGLTATAQTKEIWGQTTSGGSDSLGTIFQYDFTTATVTKKFDFVDSLGSAPANLIQADNGLLYGTTILGGVNNKGVIFQFNPVTLTYSKKFDFIDSLGTGIFSSLIKAKDGMLYGTTGINSILFQFDPLTFAFTQKVKLNVNFANIMQAADGLLYGTAMDGGKYKQGFIFQYHPGTAQYAIKFNFNDSLLEGAYPDGKMVQSAAGIMYGMAGGGKYKHGVIFQYNPSASTYKKIHDFDSPVISPETQSLMHLTLYQDSLLYGMTAAGGANNKGVIFQYNLITSTYAVKADLTYSPSKHSQLLNASDGLLYGMGIQGPNSNSNGILFQFNPITFSYVNKHDFDGINGSYPYSSLIEISKAATGISSQQSIDNLLFYPNPCHAFLTVKLKNATGNPGELKLINVLGKTVMQLPQITDNGFTIDMSTYSNGIYFIELTQNQKRYRSKVLKN